MSRSAATVTTLLRAALRAAPSLLIAALGLALLESLLQLLQPLLRRVEAGAQFGLRQLLAASGALALLGRHDAEN